MGCLYRDYPQPASKSVASARTQSLRYVASHSDAASFGEQWFDLATASGIYKDETDTEVVVVIGDGAAWIWNLSDEYFPGAVEIVDYMHAKSHLYEVAKQAFGEKAEKNAPSFFLCSVLFVSGRGVFDLGRLALLARLTFSSV